jgi:homoserine kinase
MPVNLKYKKMRIRVFAPATVANVGSGFDIFGFALNTPGDELLLQVTPRPGVKISRITGEDGQLPLEAEKNTAGGSILAMLQALQADFGVQMELYKKMPIGSGLGSSAASAVASVFALNSLLKNPLPREELLTFAIEGEKIASGASVHLDNIAACLYGGFILVRSRKPHDIVSIPTPPDLYCTIIHPRIEIKTSISRLMLRNQIPLETAITQWGNVGGMITALFKRDYDLLSRSLKDVVAEPVRSILIPHFKELNDLALRSGALGCSIAGSGPSVFALSAGRTTAKKIGAALQKFLSRQQIEHDLYVSAINQAGPKIIKLEKK